MKTIIRIEHECGNGLWYAITKDGWTHLMKMNCWDPLNEKHNNFNTPKEDNLNITKEDYCAFKSIEQIQQWIEPEWFKEIIEVGFKIWMIDVSECQEGSMQILFKKEHIMSKKDITSLFI